MCVYVFFTSLIALAVEGGEQDVLFQEAAAEIFIQRNLSWLKFFYVSAVPLTEGMTTFSPFGGRTSKSVIGS